MPQEISEIDTERKRISLSIKQTLEEEAEEQSFTEKLEDAVEEAADKVEDFIDKVADKVEDMVDKIKGEDEDEE